MSAVFVINPGGSSKKYALYIAGTPVLEAVYEKISDSWQVTRKEGVQQEKTEKITEKEYSDSIQSFSTLITLYLRENKVTLSVIGVRVLAAGSAFQKHQVIDDVFLSELRAKEPTAPLHIPATLYEIQQCKSLFPGVSVVAVSDTAFFSSLPAVAREYSLPRSDAKRYDLHRFGYHGLSIDSVIDRLHAIMGRDPERVIVCHIGSGISVTGLSQGQPVYTSAGYMSSTSLPMITRGGDLDAGVLLELMRMHHGKYPEVNAYVHTRAGLKALANNDDVRLIFDKRSQGDADAAFALDYQTYEIQKAIAAALIATKGVDALVFTGTIGVRSPDFRQLVAAGLAPLGIAVDHDKNNLFLGKEGVISENRSLAKVCVMRTDEMGQIAHIALHHIEHELSTK